MSRPLGFRLGLSLLIAAHGVVLLAGFFAPYDPTEQNRSLPFAPPSGLHFFDAEGRFHFRPFAHALVEAPGQPLVYEADRSRRYPLRFFVQGAPYRIAGWLPARIHLLGVDEPGRLFLLGTDGLGRDQFSRLLHGAQISLAAGLLAAALSLGVGFLLGTLAGYHGGAVDAAIMRGAELFLALPWLYLLFAVRAMLPLHLAPAHAFFLLVAVIGLVDWARPARLVRGIVLAAREHDYVLAARSFGAGSGYLIGRHIAPETMSVLLTQAALLVPQYVLAEVTLSFVGLGVAEPTPSLGNMLSSLQQYHVLVSYWWMWIPGAALVPLFLAYHATADGSRVRA